MAALLVLNTSLAGRQAKRLITIAVIFSILLITSYLLIVTAYAGSGLVSQVGGATFVQGTKQFWVTGTKPTFSGITTVGATVSGTVGTETIAATADASGNWSWTPATDLAGDNAVTITSGATTASFTLTIGALPAGIATASADTLAPAGTITPTFLILTFGVISTGLGLWGLKRVSRTH